jgi:hypothetical protein
MKKDSAGKWAALLCAAYMLACLLIVVLQPWIGQIDRFEVSERGTEWVVVSTDSRPYTKSFKANPKINSETCVPGDTVRIPGKVLDLAAPVGMCAVYILAAVRAIKGPKKKPEQDTATLFGAEAERKARRMAMENFARREILACISQFAPYLFGDGKFAGYNEFENMEQRKPEDLEYWYVTSFLGAKLSALGEPVLRCGGNANIWGRRKSGQFILRDDAIQQIWEDAQHECPRVPSATG